MSAYQAFGELKTPSDLLRKLTHDIERLETTPQDQYAAFDFFVTAEHITDWVYPNSKANREELRSSEAILRITSHIANGAKHFEAKAKHHNSVAGIEKARYVAAGYVEEGYFKDPLIIHLTPEEATNLKTTTEVTVIYLARKVVDYWSQSGKIA